jgi:undecaprenyl diphosphate synthase
VTRASTFSIRELATFSSMGTDHGSGPNVGSGEPRFKIGRKRTTTSQVFTKFPPTDPAQPLAQPDKPLTHPRRPSHLLRQISAPSVFRAGKVASMSGMPAGVDPKRIPVHVGAVMDGNGRWASRRGLPRTDGHAAGEEALFDAVNGALDLGVKWFTVYAFSTENWKRPLDEVRFLMNFNESILVRRRDELNELGVRVRFIGRRNWRVPKRLIKQIEEAEALTFKNRRMTLSFAFNYGGRAELVDGIQRMIADGVRAKDVDDKLVSSYLYAPDMPDPELMVRTSGEFRTSNFLLWQLAYSELVFTDVLWPDFRREDLFEAVREYQRRERRFGGVESAD